MRKIISISVIVLTLLLSLTSCLDKLPFSKPDSNNNENVPIDENTQGLSFFLKNDGTYAVEIGEAKYLTKIEIPATYNDKSVTEIGSFGYVENSQGANTHLKEIIIPDSVKVISDNAFNKCTALTNVTFGTGLTQIGKSAFENCDSLVEFVIPDSVTHIGERAFLGCDNLTKVIIGNNVIALENLVLSYCNKLSYVVIPKSVKRIHDDAFWNTSPSNIYYYGSKEDWNNLKYSTSPFVYITYDYKPES